NQIMVEVVYLHDCRSFEAASPLEDSFGCQSISHRMAFPRTSIVAVALSLNSTNIIKARFSRSSPDSPLKCYGAGVQRGDSSINSSTVSRTLGSRILLAKRRTSTVLVNMSSLKVPGR